MPYRSVTVFHGQAIPASCPGVENAWTRIYLDDGDSIDTLGVPEVSDATVLAVANVAISLQPLVDRQNANEVIPVGEAVTFDCTISKPGGYELPADEYVVIPYTTTNGDERRAKQVFSLVDALHYGGGILPSLLLSGWVAFGEEAVAWGWGGIAFGFGA